MNIFLEYLINIYERNKDDTKPHTGSIGVPLNTRKKNDTLNSFTDKQIDSALKDLNKQTTIIPQFINSKKETNGNTRYTINQKQYSFLTGLLKYVEWRQTSHMSAESFMFI